MRSGRWPAQSPASMSGCRPWRRRLRILSDASCSGTASTAVAASSLRVCGRSVGRPAGDDVVDDQVEGPGLLVVVVDQARRPDHHRAAVVHRVVERRPGQHQPVERGHRDADRRGRASAAASRRPPSRGRRACRPGRDRPGRRRRRPAGRPGAPPPAIDPEVRDQALVEEGEQLGPVRDAPLRHRVSRVRGVGDSVGHALILPDAARGALAHSPGGQRPDRAYRAAQARGARRSGHRSRGGRGTPRAATGAVAGVTAGAMPTPVARCRDGICASHRHGHGRVRRRRPLRPRHRVERRSDLDLRLDAGGGAGPLPPELIVPPNFAEAHTAGSSAIGRQASRRSSGS